MKRISNININYTYTYTCVCVCVYVKFVCSSLFCISFSQMEIRYGKVR